VQWKYLKCEKSIEDILPSISLQLNRRHSAGRGLERRPRAPRPAGPTRDTPEECVDVVLDCRRQIYLQLNDFKQVQKLYNYIFRVSAVRRDGVTGATPGRGSPPNPTSAGDNL
jgi:hypothetical protein